MRTHDVTQHAEVSFPQALHALYIHDHNRLLSGSGEH